MTRVPANLRAVRDLYLTHLDAHPGRRDDADLDPDEVGIVGDTNHRGGYHCGSDRVVNGDYSVIESPRDRAGLTRDAAALDIGWFDITVAGRRHTLRTYSVWLVRQCVAGTPDTRDIREVIYSPDGRTVKRWDRLRRRSSGDTSHLRHTHFSFFRDAIASGRDQTAVVRRYLTEIGLLENDDMQLTDKVALVTKYGDVHYSSPTTTVAGVLASTNYYVLQIRNKVLAELADAKARDAAILAAVTGQTHDQVLAAITEQGERTRAELASHAAEDAERDADLAELIHQYQTGGLDAAAVVDQIAARLQQRPQG